MYGPTPLPVTGRPNARTHAKILEACKTPEDVFYGFKWKYSIFEGFIWRSPKWTGSWERLCPTHYGKGMMKA